MTGITPRPELPRVTLVVKCFSKMCHIYHPFFFVYPYVLDMYSLVPILHGNTITVTGLTRVCARHFRHRRLVHPLC